MAVVTRTEVMEVEKSISLSLVCYQVKNLYNRANYLYKQKQKEKKYLSYYDLDKLLKTEESYKLLPAHTALYF